MIINFNSYDCFLVINLAESIQKGSVNRFLLNPNERVGVRIVTCGPIEKTDLKPTPLNPIVWRCLLLERPNWQKRLQCIEMKSSPL